jgi:hypothetical protein
LDLFWAKGNSKGKVYANVNEWGWCFLRILLIFDVETFMNFENIFLLRGLLSLSAGSFSLIKLYAKT